MVADHPPRTRNWRSAAMAGLIGCNLALAGLYLEARQAHANVNACTALNGEISQLRAQLAVKERAIEHLTGRLRGIAIGNIQSVEKALSGTGIAVERLIRRGRTGADQGGPFIPDDTPLGAAARDMERWDSLQRVMAVLPLGAPMETYVVTSGFGSRADPINKRRARHQGIDLKAPRGTPVQATGPGTVSIARTMGRYGKLVEIDHGLGVRTRYAHLHAIHVKQGQRVYAGQSIGKLGSTGRTTGPHLHYEVIVDGNPNNPKRFITAGKRLMAR